MLRAAITTLVASSLIMTACGSTIAGGEDAGETTAASGTDGTGESSDEGEPRDCGHVVLAAEYHPPVVMFVVDSSPSMLREWDHDGDPNTPPQTRWASAHALLEAIAGALGQKLVVGLQRFPSADACPSADPISLTCADASACSVAGSPELALAEGGAAQLLAAVPGPDAEPVEHAGASPAAAAYASALSQVLEHPDEDAYRRIALLTDGHVNCGPSAEPPDNFGSHDESLRSLIEDAYLDHGIFTHVIAVDEAADPSLDASLDAIPNFDPRPALHELGLAGGVGYADPTQAYLSADDPNQVQLHFTPFDEDIVTCVVDLTQTVSGPPTPEQIPLVTWTVDGEPIPYVEPEVCDSQPGWTWLVDEYAELGEIVLFCGDVCEGMKDGGYTIEGRYGCPDQP